MSYALLEIQTLVGQHSYQNHISGGVHLVQNMSVCNGVLYIIFSLPSKMELFVLSHNKKNHIWKNFVFETANNLTYPALKMISSCTFIGMFRHCQLTCTNECDCCFLYSSLPMFPCLKQTTLRMVAVMVCIFILLLSLLYLFFFLFFISPFCLSFCLFICILFYPLSAKKYEESRYLT